MRQDASRRSAARYYPAEYYSLAEAGAADRGRSPVRVVRRGRSAVVLHRLAPGRLRRVAFRSARVPDWVDWLSGTSTRAKILDVGCGGGALLRGLRANGFTNLTGIDPFLTREETSATLTLRRAELEDVVESASRFDLIMLHHVLEHLPGPTNVLDRIRRLLAPDGRVLIRTPLADSLARRAYGACWVQLDAPRHLYVHSTTSLRLLGEQAGLALVSAKRDSTGFQFWGSELYRRGMVLHGNERFFEEADYARWEARSIRLNRNGRGDQAAFVLAPA